MMRIFALLGCLLLSFQIALGNSAIVLIAPSAAGPNVRSETYSHPLWITWPKAADGSGFNQLVSIATQNSGIPVTEANFIFRSRPYGQFLNVANNSKYRLPDSFWVSGDIVALQLGENGIDKGILAMASCSYTPIRIRKSIVPKDHLIYCARAISWDDVAKVSRQIDGDVAVVEFPPLEGRRWSRMWSFRKGKVKGPLAIGLLPSDRLLDFLEPSIGPGTTVIVNPVPSARAGSPDRWLAIGEWAGAVRTGLYVSLWIATLVSLAFLAREVSKTSSRVAFYAFVSLYLGYRLLPLFVLWSGVGLWWFWWVLVAGILLGAFVALDQNAGENSVNPFVTIGLPVLLVANLAPWNASPFGPIYALNQSGSPENLAVDLIFGTYFYVCLRGKGGILWFLSRVALPAMMAAKFVSGSIYDGAQLDNYYFLVAFFFVLPGLVSRILAWLSLGVSTLVVFLNWDEHVWRGYSTADVGARATVDYFEWVRQIMRPESAIVILGVLCAVVFSSRFEFDRLKKAWIDSPCVKPLFWVVAMSALWPLSNPYSLGVLPWTIGLAYLLWSQEALRKL